MRWAPTHWDSAVAASRDEEGLCVLKALRGRDELKGRRNLLTVGLW